MVVRELKIWPFYIKLASVLFSLIALFHIVNIAKEILSPLVFSCLFSILLLPLANLFETRFKLRRSAASMLSVVLLLSGIGLLLYVIGTQVSGLAGDWPMFRLQLGKSLNDLQNWIAETFHINASSQITYVHSATTRVMSSGAGLVGATLLSLSSLLLFFVFIFIYTFFFLLYRRLIMRFLTSVFLEKNKIVVHDIVEQVQYMIRNYITGLLLEMAIVAGAVCIAFEVMGVKYALLLGLLTGLLNIIPYVGILTALLLSVLIAFATAATLSKLIMIVIVLSVIHLIDSNVLMPVIVGRKVRINALITVLGVVIGEMVWGVTGMFLSIPVIAVIKIVFDRVEGLLPWAIILGDEE